MRCFTASVSALGMILLAACDGGGPMLLDDAGPSDEPCSSADFMDQIIAFCEAQRPPPEPMAGEMGFACTEHAQCDSNICLEPFGSFETYCTVDCNDDGVCPRGYSCQDTGTSLGSVCYGSGGDGCEVPRRSVSDCIVELSNEIDLACFGDPECDSEAAALFTCRSGAGPLCTAAELDSACGVEVGLYERCCSTCDAIQW